MFFAAVRFSDEKLARLFDMARLLLQPDYARPTHITLRGPYPTKSSLSSHVGKDVGKIILRRPGCFFEGSQNTVYLAIEILGLADFWYKPDYPDGVPHLTIYDGKDRNFAWAVLRTLNSHKWGFSLNSTPMKVLDSKRALETDYIFQYENYRDTFRLLNEDVLTAEEVKNLSNLQRIVILNRICQKIHTLMNPSSTRI